MTRQTPSYRKPARWLHWSMAVLVIAAIPVGRFMVQDGLSRPLQNTLFITHKNVGVLLLVLITLRILYRWLNPPPPRPEGLAPWQARASEIMHKLLYASLVVMPLSGYIRVRAGGFPIESLDLLGIPSLVPRSDALADIAKAVHFYASWIILALILVHIAAALQHRFITRDGVFARMWPGAQ